MPDNAPGPRLVLASASPRRRDLLAKALVKSGIGFRIVPSHADETRRRGEPPDAYVARIAEAKARTVARRCPDAWVLAADTAVTLDGTVLGKPADVADARDMLRRLSGRTHRVLTGFVLCDRTDAAGPAQVVTSHVHFRTLSEAVIDAYLDTGEPFDKAGAYAVQGAGRALVDRVDGSLSNVIGLPLDEVGAALRAAGLCV